MSTATGSADRDARGSPSRRDLLLGGLFVATAAVTYARMPRTHLVAVPPGKFEGALPDRFAGWSTVPDLGFVLPPEDERRAAAVYEDQLQRSYVDPADNAVMFLVAYDRGQSGLLMIHRPESCYPGAGFTIEDSRTVDIALRPGLIVPARFMTAVRGSRVEQVLYWTRLGSAFPRDWDEQKSSLARQNLAGVIPDGALIRLSVVSPDAGQSLATMRRFAAEMFASSARLGRALLAGPVNA